MRLLRPGLRPLPSDWLVGTIMPLLRVTSVEGSLNMTRKLNMTICFGSRVRGSVGRSLGAMTLMVGVAACGDGTLGPIGSSNIDASICDLDERLLVSSLLPNAIPALTEPPMVAADAPTTSYLAETDRVLGVVINGEARAYPHNVLWHHEIINDRIDGQWISVSFCPLTGSGVAFDPNFDGRVLDLGVSGLLFANNLIIYERESGEIYGPQLEVEGRCEGFQGHSLDLMPVQEMAWSTWKNLYPDTKVVSSETGIPRNYNFYPYDTYDQLDSDELLFPMTVDRTRPLKERVLSIRSGAAGRGYPYGELRDASSGSRTALNEVVAGLPTVILYTEGSGQVALAYESTVNGQILTFENDRGGTWTDVETGSLWNIGGVATSGPLEGSRLTPRADAYTLFWFAWRHFQPGAELYRSG
jgi:hypothetical protein